MMAEPKENLSSWVKTTFSANNYVLRNPVYKPSKKQ